jgi:hypothetical protein
MLAAVLAGPSLVPGLFAKLDADAIAVALKPFAFGALLVLGVAMTASGFSERDSIKRYGAAGLAVGALALGALNAGASALSVKDLAQSFEGRVGPQDKIYVYGIYMHGLPFYTRHRVDKVLNWSGELHYAQRDPAYAANFGDESDIAALPGEGRRTFVAFRTFETRYIFSVTGPEVLKGYAAFGPWAVAEF